VLDGGYRRASNYGNRRCYESTTAGRYERDGDYRNDGYYDSYGRSSSGYGYGYGNEGGRNVATIVGGIAGAVLGSKVGGGSGRYATSAIGTMVGGLAGREVYEASQRNRVSRQGRVTVCDPVPDRYATSGGYGNADGYGAVGAYDVTYEYGGRRYTTRTGYHPGDTIRVRVDVQPE
jgi:hypothetical protein